MARDRVPTAGYKLLTMSNLLPRILPALLVALAIPVAAPAVASAAPGAPKIQSTQSRLGGGFRTARRPSFGSRYRSRPYARPRSYRRPSLFRGILQALGIAYLFHMLFGWGPGGGSPFGLFLIAAFVIWMVTRSRARRRYYAY
jgi:hypothetical protein